jgi:altronate dehydratase small subunit
MGSLGIAAAATPVAFQINANDNVATLLEKAQPGAVAVRGSGGEKVFTALEPIEPGHKMAVAFIPEGAHVIKFGVIIGIAGRPIKAGEWVHLHNCHSRLDERSNAFDVRTGVPEDVSYE